MTKVEVYQSPEIGEIFFTGNLVVSDNGELVMVTSGGTLGVDYFAGVELNSSDGCGFHTDSWCREWFKQFHGEVKITA